MTTAMTGYDLDLTSEGLHLLLDGPGEGAVALDYGMSFLPHSS